MDKVILVGNPNTGKTTLYNRLTNSDEHVGNWHGVTIDAKSKPFEVNGQTYEILDLPGIYSLTAYNPEEKVSIEYLYSHKYKILNICDINNIKQNMFLTIQLLEAGYDVRIVVNMTDSKDHSDVINNLKKVFKHNIVFVNVQKEKRIKLAIDSVLKSNTTIHIDLPYLQRVAKISSIISENTKALNLDSRFASLKIIEQDVELINRLQLSEYQVNKFKDVQLDMQELFQERYRVIDKLLNVKSNFKVHILDKILLHRLLGVPIFVGILIFIFYLTFGPVGTFLKDGLSYLIQDLLGQSLYNFMQAKDFNYVLTDFIYKGLFCGLGGIVSFLPQIVLLLFSLSILEESGYLSRLAFLFEDLLNKIGLSGKSLFALIMSCGCSTIAMMTARNIEDENIKKKTMILCPYMCCSAKLPVFVILTSTFFGGNYLLIFALYMIALLTSIVIALLLKKGLPSQNDSFILEFPVYRVPSVKKMLYFVYSNTMIFLTKIGSVLLLFSLVFYFLNTYDFNLIHIDLGGVSIMQRVCELLAPIFAPLGFGSWGAVSALVSGLVAKEIIVSSMGMINGVAVSELSQSLLDSTANLSFDAIGALSFMVFALLYVPCLSSISVMTRQLGGKDTVKAIALQFAVAYCVAFAIYWGVKLLDINVLLIIITFIILGFVILWSKKQKKCTMCCQKCRNCTKHLD